MDNLTDSDLKKTTPSPGLAPEGEGDGVSKDLPSSPPLQTSEEGVPNEMPDPIDSADSAEVVAQEESDDAVVIEPREEFVEEVERVERLPRERRPQGRHDSHGRRDHHDHRSHHGSHRPKPFITDSRHRGQNQQKEGKREILVNCSL